jgi:hypothetical protein
LFSLQAKIDRLEGGNPDALEQKVKQHYGSDDGEEDAGVQGYVMNEKIVTFQLQ